MSERLRYLPAVSPLLVYLTTKKAWEGPYLFINVDGETVFVQLLNLRRSFCTTCVKPWVKRMWNAARAEDPSNEEQLEKGELDRDEVMIASMEK